MSKELIIFRILTIIIMVLISVGCNAFSAYKFIILLSNKKIKKDKYYKYNNIVRHNYKVECWKRFIIIQSSYLFLCAIMYFLFARNLVLLSAGKSIILLGLLIISNLIAFNITYKFMYQIKPPFSFANITIYIIVFLIAGALSNVSYLNRQYTEQSKILSLEHYEVLTKSNKYLNENDAIINKKVYNDIKTEYSFYYITSEDSFEYVTLNSNIISFEKSNNSSTYIEKIKEIRTFYNLDEKEPTLKSKLRFDTKYVLYLNDELYNQLVENKELKS